MKVALTGATGFVGRHVAAELRRRGLEVTTLVRRPPAAGDDASGRRIAVVDLQAPPDDVYALAGRPDVLIHLAWSGLPNYRSLHHFETELPAQYAFLKTMVDAGLPRLVVTGTCFEYGLQSGCLAEDREARPDNPYGFAKEALRRELAFLQRERPFALTWARLFYLHGDGQAAGSLLPQLRAAVARGDTRFPMSGGEQLRDYLPVAEAARLLVDLALTDGDHGVVNVCSGAPVSVRALVEGWIVDNGWRIGLDLGRYPYPDHEPMAFWGDRRKLDRCLSRG